jgi:hypothetical protein
MGIWADTNKTYQYNINLLRGKTFFESLNQPKVKRASSKLSLHSLQKRTQIIYGRKQRREILTRTVIIPFVIIALVMLIYMISSNFSLQIP